MIFCRTEDKTATIIWTWKNQPTQRYISTVVPVDVSVAPINIDGSSAIGTWTMDTYDTITTSSPFSYKGDSTDSPVFSDRRILSSKDGRELYADSSTFAGPIQARDIKFTPDNGNGYKITISNSMGTKLFAQKKETDSPPIYEVVCGESCPKGYIKCEHPTYPGYCCLPCQSTAAKINQIANKIR